MAAIVLVVAFVLLLIAALPVWPYSRAWGYAPSGAVAVLMAVLVIMILLGFVPVTR
jgi:hypothetical protein